MPDDLFAIDPRVIPAQELLESLAEVVGGGGRGAASLGRWPEAAL